MYFLLISLVSDNPAHPSQHINLNNTFCFLSVQIRVSLI